jgi:hypothetical protein
MGSAIVTARMIAQILDLAFATIDEKIDRIDLNAPVENWTLSNNWSWKNRVKTLGAS